MWRMWRLAKAGARARVGAGWRRAWSSSSAAQDKQDVIEQHSKQLSRVHVVDSVQRAEAFMAQAKTLPKGTLFGADTEVEIDLAEQSPVENGRVTCVSLFAGWEHDFGDGQQVWVDILDGEKGVLETIKPLLESTQTKKVWHNYSFDRHVLFNHGINVRGLGGDTMHMARALDTSLDKSSGAGGYSLAALSKMFLNHDTTKTSMKDLFGVPVPLKNGKPGKIKKLPATIEIQRGADTRDDWVRYSCLDAVCTLELYFKLRDLLRQRIWVPQQDLRSSEHLTRSEPQGNQFQMYERYLVPFAEVLTDIEREGFQINRKYLEQVEVVAREDEQKSLDTFMAWVANCGAFHNAEDAATFNPGSAQQKQFLFFAKNGVLRGKGNATKEAKYKTENTLGLVEPGAKKPKKQRDVLVKGLGIKPPQYSATGWPSTSSAVMDELAGKEGSWGSAFDPLEKRAAGSGQAACEAIAALSHANAVNKLISTFIVPLQQRLDSKDRIHASLNLNTETGRLSSRNPNLQNQPALEKDLYKIRKAFTCRPGNKLIVADYGQLELRVLAHLAGCKSMIQAFEAGGDFHSRTAIGMYPHIQEALAKGEVLLEWDGADGSEPPVPLVKSKYAAERRKAKVLNFSIAYGKTAFGLSKDFGVSLEEAKETLDLWYRDRPEVREWQRVTIEGAKRWEHVRTIWGRTRTLQGIVVDKKSGLPQDHARSSAMQRAAINSPIQGSAADIVMGAMLRVSANERLRSLGWRMVLQVHDEIILEGPEENVDEALALTLYDMEHPLEYPLLVDLVVDADTADTWYDAK